MSTEPNFGKASAAKRGRNPKWPYVPIIAYGEQATGAHRTHTEQIRKRAFETRTEAVEYAQRVIDARIATHETQLATPRLRALREQHGFPRDLAGVRVVAAEPDATGKRQAGTVVRAAPDERAAGVTEMGLDGFGDCSLVDWSDGRRWQRPEDIRLVRRGAGSESESSAGGAR